MSKSPQFISKESFELLYHKLKEFIEESGVVITEFDFKFPYLDALGPPLDITVHIEMMK